MRFLHQIFDLMMFAKEIEEETTSSKCKNLCLKQQVRVDGATGKCGEE